MIKFRAVGLVAMREVSERLSGRATWIATGLTALGAVALIVIPALTNQTPRATKLGLVGPQAQTLGPAISAAAKAASVDLTIENVDSEATARSELTPPRGGSGGGRPLSLFNQSQAVLDVALLYDGTSAKIEVYQSVPPAVSALLRAVIDAVHQRDVLTAAGVPAAQIAAADRPVPLSVAALQAAPSDLTGRRIAGLAAALLLMYGVGGFGAAVAQGVAQEKTSRTAEVLLAAVTPRDLMTGKVLGIGLVGVGQMTITVIAALITNAFVHSQAVPSELPQLLPMILVWFVLGFTLYAFAFAAAGAMVARQEEVQSVSMPIAGFFIVGILLVYATIAQPDAPWIRLLSFFPPLSPGLMPARMAVSTLAWWETPLAIVIELASIAAMARLAGRIYQGALVRGGARLSWRSALQMR